MSLAVAVSGRLGVDLFVLELTVSRFFPRHCSSLLEPDEWGGGVTISIAHRPACSKADEKKSGQEENMCEVLGVECSVSLGVLQIMSHVHVTRLIQRSIVSRTRVDIKKESISNFQSPFSCATTDSGRVGFFAVLTAQHVFSSLLKLKHTRGCFFARSHVFCISPY